MALTPATLLKTTLLDYPGEIASVVFTPGCNLRCPYCHNPSMVENAHENDELIPIDEVKQFLNKRKHLIGAVVISGGEPLIYDDIMDLVSYIKSLGLKVKIDTNGLNPERLKELDADYIAMDIKTSPFNYTRLGHKEDGERILQSIEYIIDSGIDHEFRTTVTEEIITESDMEHISPLLDRAQHWYFTPFKAGNTLDSNYRQKEPPAKEYMEKLLSIAIRAGISSSIR